MMRRGVIVLSQGDQLNLYTALHSLSQDDLEVDVYETPFSTNHPFESIPRTPLL